MTLISSEISFLKKERQSTYEEYSTVHCKASLASSKSQTVYPNLREIHNNQLDIHMWI